MTQLHESLPALQYLHEDPGRFTFTLTKSNVTVPTASGAASTKLFNSYSLDVSTDTDQMVKPTHYIDQLIHCLSNVADTDTNVYPPITIGYLSMSAQEITDAITPVILYLQECTANQILPHILHRITNETSDALQCLKICLEHIQDLTPHPTVILVPDIKCTDAILCQNTTSTSIQIISCYTTPVEHHTAHPVVPLKWYINQNYLQIQDFPRFSISPPGSTRSHTKLQILPNYQLH